jgi:outer membrane immunogenic protein
MIRVQKSLLGLTVGAAIALVAPSAMADGYVQPAKYYSPWSWTGCYLGGNLGGGWTDRKADRLTQDGIVGPVPGDYGRNRESGIVGGTQIGCDLQVDRSWVIGVQGQFDLSDMNGRIQVPFMPIPIVPAQWLGT